MWRYAVPSSNIEGINLQSEPNFEVGDDFSKIKHKERDSIVSLLTMGENVRPLHNIKCGVAVSIRQLGNLF